MRKIGSILLILIFTMKGLNGQAIKMQLGFEVGKYFRDFSTINRMPFEVVGMAKHNKKIRIYPRISFGYGDFTKSRRTYKFTTAGFYMKPGIEFYFGNKEGKINGVISGNYIFGRYNASNHISIENPVWGDATFDETYRKQNLSGIEFSYGFAWFIQKRFEFKMLLGFRGVTESTAFSRSSKGVIPGFGYGKQGYTASSFCGIIFSYKL